MTEQLVLSEGKTKRIISCGQGTDEGMNVLLESKDDITAGDGKKHDVLPGKGAFANQTTCNVFRLLKSCRIPVAFIDQIGPTTFTASKCTMLPYEVVVRREAHGSYLKRAPHLKKGHIFPCLKVEFFLKTNGKKWKEHDLICDDPYMVYDSDESEIRLFDPGQPDLAQSPAVPFLTLNEDEVFTFDTEDSLLQQMGAIARRTFLILEKAWQLQGKKLLDFKVEFGIDSKNKLRLADVIDNDSWRITDGARGDVSKQAYRDGESLDVVIEKYRRVAEATERFCLPAQQLILWRGSIKDDLTPFYEGLVKKKILPKRAFESVDSLRIVEVECSAHKKPVLAYRLLQKSVSEVSDTVIIAYIGMSNGAGPMLSANTTVPVITVPQSWKEFPDDIWSSLRTPSAVPVMTVPDPANAMLAALQIFALRNPHIYSILRFEQEKRLDEI